MGSNSHQLGEPPSWMNPSLHGLRGPGFSHLQNPCRQSPRWATASHLPPSTHRSRWAPAAAGTLPCPLVRFEAAVPRPAGTGAAGAGATATASAGATATVQVPPTLPAPGSPPLLPLLPHHRNYGGGQAWGLGLSVTVGPRQMRDRLSTKTSGSLQSHPLLQTKLCGNCLSGSPGRGLLPSRQQSSRKPNPPSPDASK